MFRHYFVSNLWKRNLGNYNMSYNSNQSTSPTLVNNSQLNLSVETPKPFKSSGILDCVRRTTHHSEFRLDTDLQFLK